MTSDRWYEDHYLGSICVCTHRWGDHRPNKTCAECDCQIFKERSAVISDTKPFPQELYEIADMLGLSLYDLSVLCLKESARTSSISFVDLAHTIKYEAQLEVLLANEAAADKTLSLDNSAFRLGRQMFKHMRDYGFYGRP
jgi:hypothetical protein